MNETNNLTIKEYSNVKKNEEYKRLFNSKIDLKKVFAKKLKNKLNNANNSQILKSQKRSTESKNSQTILKKYDYLNKLFKANDLKESLNSITSLKNIHSTKDALSYKMDKIKFIRKERDKARKNFYKKANSVKSRKLHFSFGDKEAKKKPFLIYKSNDLKFRKIKIKKNMSTYSYKGHENLENIGCDFPNYSNEYVKSFRDNFYNRKNKKEKYELDENNKNSINYSASQYLLINKYIKDFRKVNKKIFLRNNELKPKSNNIMIQTNNNNLNSKKDKSKIYWHNEILQKLITNINKNINPNMIFKNVALSDDNFNFPQKIRMSTLLNLYNNWNNKSI